MEECYFYQSCSKSKSNTPPWVFFAFFKLYKLYQIPQRVTYSLRLPIN